MVRLKRWAKKMSVTLDYFFNHDGDLGWPVLAWSIWFLPPLASRVSLPGVCAGGEHCLHSIEPLLLRVLSIRVLDIVWLAMLFMRPNL